MANVASLMLDPLTETGTQVTCKLITARGQGGHVCNRAVGKPLRL